MVGPTHVTDGTGDLDARVRSIVQDGMAGCGLGRAVSGAIGLSAPPLRRRVHP